MIIRTIILGLLLLNIKSIANNVKLTDYLYSTWQNEKMSFSYFPDLQFGTHRNGVGVNGEGCFWLPIGNIPIGTGIKVDLNGMCYEEYFGLPGRLASVETGGRLSFGWGKSSNFGKSKWIRVSPYRHSIHYRCNYYFSTDQTSQIYAEYQYELNISNISFILREGNDDQAFTHTDKFRSAAVDLNLYINKTNYLLGYAFGIKLWHGDYTEQLYLNHNQTYDFNNIVGGEYTLGLLYGSLTFNCFKISIGYDSDRIRTFFQNKIHKIVNNGMVPDVKRDNRIYFDLSIFGNNGQW